MKIKSLTIALIASLAIVLGTSSCSSDDEPEAPVATQVAGSYTGNEVIMVDNEESSNETKTITGKLASYSGTVKNAKGEEKAYVVSNVALIFGDKTVAGTYSLKYGNMPFIMTTSFTGTLK